APDTTPPLGHRARPSGQRSARPGSPPHRFLDPEGSRALEHITLHRQLGVLLAQPVQLVALVLAQRAFTTPSTPVQVHPSTQRALVQPQLPGHLRDRLARLPDDPHRAFPELPIEISPLHRQSLPSRRCLYGTRGSPALVCSLVVVELTMRLTRSTIV